MSVDETLSPNADFGAVVVGAGFAGIQMVHELRQLGVSVRLIEEASDVGGTWFWNRYPGARTDTEAWVYCFSFSKELCQEWDWKERYPSQPESLAYLKYVVERYDLRRDMQFETRVESARYDEAANRWIVRTDRNQIFTCRYLVLATGPLSRPLKPAFDGLDSFEGEWYLTARWPHEAVDFSGKRVGIIGVGATGIQVIPVIATQAEHVTVFQRTPNYVINAANRPLSDEERSGIKRRYDQIWERARGSWDELAIERPLTKLTDLKPEQQAELLEGLWAGGGFEFFATFKDVMVDKEANDVLSDFIRSKIRASVDDPTTAELLCPKNYPFGAKRPPLGHGYYEAFNRENVSLVDVATSPIQCITTSAVRTRLGDYPVDILIFALGFDASTGALLAMDIRGRDGRQLEEKWRHGPRTYLGICAEGFPNMFMIAGPQSPFSNMPMVIDGGARWTIKAISLLNDGKIDYLDPTSKAVDYWCAEADAFLEARPMQTAGNHRSFFVGANVVGKPQGTYFYFGGLSRYLEHLKTVDEKHFVTSGFRGIASEK